LEQNLILIIIPINVQGKSILPRGGSPPRGRPAGASYKFSTFSLPILATFYFEWSSIVNGCAIKHLPVNIYELLTPVAIAFWISSDGSYSKRDGIVVISTDNFTLAEVQLLQSILLQKFNIHSTYGTHGKVGQYRIRIRKSSIPLLQSLVAPHMPHMMTYRVGL